MVFLNEIGEVLGGLKILGNLWGHIPSLLNRSFIPENAFRRGESPYYVGYDAFDPETGTTGFLEEYNPYDHNQVQHFVGGASGGNAFGNAGGYPRDYLLDIESEFEDINLYNKAFEFVDFLQSGHPLYMASWWVLTNLGK